MRKLIVQEYISVDGFAADRDKTTSFFDGTRMNIGKEVDVYMVEFIKTIDSILLGRKTYEMFLDYWPNIDPKEDIVGPSLNATDKYIFSNTLENVEWGDWDSATLVNENYIDFIHELKAKPGKNIVVWGSLSLTKSLFEAKLVDELHLMVCPVAIGKGYHFLSEQEELLKLKLVSNNSFPSSVVNTIYQVLH